MRNKMLMFFDYEHLPAELQKISKPFGDLARLIEGQIFPPNPESEMALRKLLEAKDCAVRAQLWNKDRPK